MIGAPLAGRSGRCRGRNAEAANAAPTSAASASVLRRCPSVRTITFYLRLTFSICFSSRYKVPTGRLDFNRSTVRKLSSDSQTSAWPFVREQALRFDAWLEHDRVELAGGHFDVLAAVDLDDDRIAIGVIVAVERVRLADDERNRAHEVDERPLVERLGDAREFLPVAGVHPPVGIELVRLVGAVFRLVDVLHVAQRDEVGRVEPALVVVVHVKEEQMAFDVEHRVVRPRPRTDSTSSTDIVADPALMKLSFA